MCPTTIVPSDGDTSTEATDCATVTTADPDAGPVFAVIVAVPSTTAVTSPDASTVATEVSPLLHVTVAPAITRAFWSRTSAVSCTVAPSAVSSAAAGLTVSVVERPGSGGGVGGAAGLSPPHAPARPRAASTAQSRTVAPRRWIWFFLVRRIMTAGSSETRWVSRTLGRSDMGQRQRLQAAASGIPRLKSTSRLSGHPLEG